MQSSIIDERDRHAVAMAPATPGPDLSPTHVERRLLALLAEGLTDEAAARRLHISVRSERRIVADLMRRLDATSRFEAGVKAARWGWI